MDKSNAFQYYLKARGYELDSYDHVNNAVYLNYLEQARWDIFRQLRLLDLLKGSGKKIVIVEINIRYIKEVRLFDEIMIETRMEKEAPYLVFYQRLTNTASKLSVARAKVKTIFLDKDKVPCDIPQEIFITLNDAE